MPLQGSNKPAAFTQLYGWRLLPKWVRATGSEGMGIWRGPLPACTYRRLSERGTRSAVFVIAFCIMGLQLTYHNFRRPVNREISIFSCLLPQAA